MPVDGRQGWPGLHLLRGDTNSVMMGDRAIVPCLWAPGLARRVLTCGIMCMPVQVAEAFEGRLDILVSPRLCPLSLLPPPLPPRGARGVP
jgi:hypothetical protein